MNIGRRNIGILAGLLTLSQASALTYQLATGNESWPADKRAAIVAAMDEAVATYNANGYFDKAVWANYDPGVPTAQANYAGWIDFGGQISARTAMHELSHTLGVGTYWGWAGQKPSGVWTGTYAVNRIHLFDGPSAVINCDTLHFWPYGLNYYYEDSPEARIRHVKIVSAMRRDMGIVADSDNDGLPDDWEMFCFGNLSQTANSDPDTDGKNNLTEYNNDTNPTVAIFDWKGGNGTWDTTTANWTGTTALWRNLAADTASFGGSPGTVTMGTGVRCGQLQFAASGYLITGGTLELLAPDAVITCLTGPNTIASSLQGSGGLSKQGAGQLELSGNNSYTAATTVGAGTLVLSGNNTAKTGTTSVANGSTLQLQANAGNTMAGISTALSSNTPGTLNLSGGTLQLRSDQDVTFAGGDDLGGLGGMSLTMDVNPLTPGNTNQTIIFAPAGFNTYYTTLNITGGSGYTLKLGGIVNGYNTPLTLNANSANLSIGNIGTATAVSTLAIGGASDTVITGAISGSGTTVTKSGAGKLTLTQANTYSGETLVSDGLLQLGADSGSNPEFGTLENSSLLTINTGATVRAMGANAFKGYSGGNMDVTLNGGTLTMNDGVTQGGNHNLGNVTLNGGTISGLGDATYGGFLLTSSVNVTENSTISATNTNTNSGTATITVSPGKTLNWTGTITNAYGNAASTLIFEGTGTTVLSGINSYTGNTTINDGTLELADNAQLKFAVTDSNATAVTGTGTATFKGDFNIDTTAVTLTTGTWTLSNVTTQSFVSTFTAVGFTPNVDGVTWTKTEGAKLWTFSETTGQLTLGPSASDYDSWKSFYGVTGTPSQDDDKDGLTNQQEYAFGLIPNSGASVNPITAQLNKTTGTFTYTRRDPVTKATGLTYTIWTSTNLATWTQETNLTAVQNPGAPDGNGIQSVLVTLTPAPTAPKLFIQVRAN